MVKYTFRQTKLLKKKKYFLKILLFLILIPLFNIFLSSIQYCR